MWSRRNLNKMPLDLIHSKFPIVSQAEQQDFKKTTEKRLAVDTIAANRISLIVSGFVTWQHNKLHIYIV
jgi:hypothetical protein